MTSKRIGNPDRGMRRRRRLRESTRPAAVLVATLCLMSSVASAAPRERHPFTAADLFGIRYAVDPQLRPDGAVIAYVRMTADIMTDRYRPSIWLVDTSTGAQSPLVVDESANFSPHWSPDGTRLAYVSAGTRGGLYVYSMRTGRAARVANLEQAPGSVTWSHDGKMLAFTMLVPGKGNPLPPSLARPEGAKWADPPKVIDSVTYRLDAVGYLQPGFFHVFVVSADGGQPRQITLGNFNDDGPLTFAADDRSLVFSADRNGSWQRDAWRSDLYRVSILDGTLTRLTDRVGLYGSPAVSPDGSRIAYVGHDERPHSYNNSQLYVMNRDGSHRRSLTAALDRSVSHPRWAADGQSVYVSYDDRGIGKIARVTLDGRVQPVAKGLAGMDIEVPYSGGADGYSFAKGMIAFTQGGPYELGDVAVVRQGRIERLTRLNRDLFADRQLAGIEPLPTISSYDKKPIDAWLMTPPDFNPRKKYPLILEIHGGPAMSYGPLFSTELQLYAAAGFVVIYSNPRGSTSYGDAFANADASSWPNHDYDDLMSVVAAALAKGFVDRDRLYVTGGSFGGLMTAWIVGSTHRFRAAVAQKPVIDFETEMLTTDRYVGLLSAWFDKMPWNDLSDFWARSPLSRVGNVTTPTMLMVGEQDYRTPPSQAEEFYQALQLRAVPTSLVLIPGVGHTTPPRPSLTAAKVAATLGWFRRFGAVAGEEAPGEAGPARH